MNIGIVTVWFERGAAYVSRAYREALSAGHRVFIYARGGERPGQGTAEWDGADVTWAAPVEAMPDQFIPFSDFKQWVQQCRLDAVIFNEQHEWNIILEARKLDVLLGAYVDYYTPQTAPFYSLYDFLLCNTRRHFSVFKDHPQALFIPWGTDTQVFCPRTAGLVVPGQVTFFHSCGLSAWRKGTDLLVQAFQQVRGPVRLVVHAQDQLEKCFTWTRGDEAGATRRLVRQDPRIEVIERAVTAPGLYHQGDVYVYPTRLEGIGLTIAEACAAGLPVITTDAPPMNEMVPVGSGGRLVPVERCEPRWDGYYWPMSVCSPAALAATMQFYADHLAELPEYKRQARVHAETHLDWRRNAHELPGKIPQLQQRRDLASSSLLESVRQFERSAARFRWLPIGWEARLRRLGCARPVRAMKALWRRPASTAVR